MFFKHDKHQLEKANRSKEVRRRFRHLIRDVALNRSWLAEGEEDRKITMNVKRNIAMLVRTQRKIGVLTMAEKGLIRCQHAKRSVEDRRNMVKLLTNLTCFSTLPPVVIAHLVPVIKFMYLGPGRIIIKEGDRPDSLYFILYGEVEVSKKVYNPILEGYQEKLQFIYGPGDSIGEVELIEGGLRRNTFTTSNDVELLVIYGPDFEKILKPIMSEQWQHRMQSLRAIGYFDLYNQDQLINACKLAFVKEFSALETIYFEDKGQLSYVHFILSGECMILQCLKLKVKENKFGQKKYTLVDLPKHGRNILLDDTRNTRDDVLGAIRASLGGSARRSYDIDEELESDSEEETELIKIKRALRTMDLLSIEAGCKQRELAEMQARAEAEALAKAASQPKSSSTKPAIKRVSIKVERFSKDSDQDSIVYEEVQEDEAMSSRESEVSGITEYDSQPEYRFSQPLRRLTLQEVEREARKSKELAEIAAAQRANVENDEAKGSDEERLSDAINRNSQKDESHSHSSSRESETEQHAPSPAKISLKTVKGDVTYENHFIDVGTLSFGGIFGLGERLEHRVIMARTKVQCLMLPRFWLYEAEQNPGNIWQRRRFILDSHVPSREELFQNFLNTRKWNKFKNNYINSILDSNSMANPTKLEDIPVMLRITGGNEDFD